MRASTGSRLAVSLLVALLAGACDLRGPSPSAEVPSSVILSVVNDSWLDMDLYVVHGATRSRVGHVGSLGRIEIEISDQLLAGGEIVVLADPVGATETYATPAIAVVGHTQIDLLLSNVLSQSSYQVNEGSVLDTGALGPGPR